MILNVDRIPLADYSKFLIFACMFDICYAQAALNSSNGDVICQDDYDPHVIASECCAVATVKQRNLFYCQKIKPIN
jgi:hypothetical protein